MDVEHREQHNHGSGTFVGRDVYGGIWNIFLPPYRRKPTSGQPPHKHRTEQDDGAIEDYEEISSPLFAWFIVSCAMAVATLREIMGWPLSSESSPPGIFERVIGTLVFFYVFLACVAAFFARLAQVFELWSEQCAITATHSRGRWVARPPALMAYVMAGLVTAATAIAEVLASFHGWRSFGGEVSQRAHTARLNAAANAESARLAAKKARP